MVRDAKYLTIREDPRCTVYRPLSQAPRSLMTLHVSTKGDPAAVAPLVEGEVRALDPTVPLFQVQSMRGRIDDSLRQERLMAALGRALGTLGSLLAMIGLYGVVNYAVVRRTRDIALRMALGATPRRIMVAVFQRTLILALAGIIVGVPCALLMLRLFGTFLRRCHQHRAGADRDGLILARCHCGRRRTPARLARFANRSDRRTSTERMTGNPDAR